MRFSRILGALALVYSVQAAVLGDGLSARSGRKPSKGGFGSPAPEDDAALSIRGKGKNKDKEEKKPEENDPTAWTWKNELATFHTDHIIFCSIWTTFLLGIFVFQRDEPELNPGLENLAQAFSLTQANDRLSWEKLQQIGDITDSPTAANTGVELNDVLSEPQAKDLVSKLQELYPAGGSRLTKDSISAQNAALDILAKHPATNRVTKQVNEIFNRPKVEAMMTSVHSVANEAFPAKDDFTSNAGKILNWKSTSKN